MGGELEYKQPGSLRHLHSAPQARMPPVHGFRSLIIHKASQILKTKPNWGKKSLTVLLVKNQYSYLLSSSLLFSERTKGKGPVRNTNYKSLWEFIYMFSFLTTMKRTGSYHIVGCLGTSKQTYCPN